MKLITTVFVSLLFVSFTLKGQVKNSHYFRMPANINAAEYAADVVLVKVKSQHRGIFTKSQSGSKAAADGAKLVSPLFPSQLVNNARARTAPRKPVSGIDLTDYYQIQVDPAEGIEKVINRLYATGYFEVVEPSYRYYQSYTPNDPLAVSQYYLDKIKAREAWDISKSDESVVIAIIDSGVDMDHLDLSPKLFINENEVPNNGIDDDNNGFVDDVHGWDFSGAEEALIGTVGFNGDNNPAVTKGGTHSHGTMVGGCAAAATDNGRGIAGVGYNARLLFTKHYADDQPNDDRFYSSNLYLGILYAATVLSANNIDKKIINCSFGGSGRSQVIQDFINLVTLDYGCLVIAAAGNNSSEALHYPAAYTNVLSVASTDASDRKSSFSNFGTWVDVSSPGSAILTSTYLNTYENTNGTSFSSPITAGAAALVWSAFPELTPQQVAEKLRVTSDESFYSSNISSLAYKLGKGRLNVFNALTKNFPSLRASKIKIQNQQGSSAVRPGQTGKLFFDISNILSTTSANVKVSITSSSSAITFTKNTLFPGTITHNGAISLKQNPFIFNVASNIASNLSTDLIISYSDGEYEDFEVVTINLNPSYIDLEENQVSTTVSSKGRIGYDGEGQTTGLGFQFNGTPLLYEMGIIMGNSSSTILNNVRSISSRYDQDFVEVGAIDQIIPGDRSATEIFGKLSNSTTPASQSIVIDYRSLLWKESPNEKFIIMEYKLTNPTAVAIENYYMGLFADWDIAAGDGADWNSDQNIGYVFPKTNAGLPIAGIQVLTGNASGYAIDNNQDTPGAAFGLYDGYTDQEKFTTLSTLREEAGVAEDGGDVSHVVSSGPHTIPPNGEIIIAFAVHAATDLEQLIESAEAADILYNQTLQAPVPVVPEVFTCYGGTADITASGATSFKWYHDFTGGEAFFTGTQLTTGLLLTDTLFYVSNADNSYESVRSPAVVTLKANPQITSSGPPSICEGSSITLRAEEADEYLWSTGAITQSIEVSDAGSYSVIVRDIALGCESVSTDLVTNTIPAPTAAFSSADNSFTGALITFTDESIGAVSWLWRFGDGSTSIQKNPSYKFTDNGNFDVTLTVTAANGCQSTITNPISIITGVENEFRNSLVLYPNPAKEKIIIEAESTSVSSFTVDIITTQGQKVYSAVERPANGKFSHTISTSNLPAGMYLIRISNAREWIVRKMVKTDL